MEKTVYRSKVDKWLICLVCGAIIGSYGLALLTEVKWTLVLAGLLTLAVVLLLIFDIKYIITGDRLVVSAFLGLFKSTYDVSKIGEVRATRSLLSAPAASLDRLEVKCGRSSVIISPKAKQNFIAHLLKINGDILVTV